MSFLSWYMYTCINFIINYTIFISYSIIGIKHLCILKIKQLKIKHLHISKNNRTEINFWLPIVYSDCWLCNLIQNMLHFVLFFSSQHQKNCSSVTHPNPSSSKHVHWWNSTKHEEIFLLKNYSKNNKLCISANNEKDVWCFIQFCYFLLLIKNSLH